MKVSQLHWTKDTGWSDAPTEDLKKNAQLVFVFGGTELLKQKDHWVNLMHSHQR